MNQEDEAVKNKTLCNECGKEFNSKGALTKHMKTHQTDLHDVDASILRENFNKKKVLKFSNSNTLEETAEKFNLNRRVLEDWLKIASRQFCCEFCSKGFAVRWRLTEHQKRLHFTKEEWAMSVEGRHQRQNIEKVKLDVMPSLEEMLTKKYINTLEQKVNQFLVLDLVQVLVLVLALAHVLVQALAHVLAQAREYQMTSSLS